MKNTKTESSARTNKSFTQGTERRKSSVSSSKNLKTAASSSKQKESETKENMKRPCCNKSFTKKDRSISNSRRSEKSLISQSLVSILHQDPTQSELASLSYNKSSAAFSNINLRPVLTDQTNTFDGQIINIYTPKEEIAKNLQSENQQQFQTQQLIYSPQFISDRQPSAQFQQDQKNMNNMASRQSTIQTTLINPHLSIAPMINHYSPAVQQLNSNFNNFQSNKPTLSNRVLPDRWQLIISNLDQFWRDRVAKLKDCLQQVFIHAQEDDLVKTMMENEETQLFADQRIQELIREGLNVEQELQINQLSKKLLLTESEQSKYSAERDSLYNQLNMQHQVHQQYQNEFENLKLQHQQDLKQKKAKFQSKLDQAISLTEKAEKDLKQQQIHNQLINEQLQSLENQMQLSSRQDQYGVQDLQKQVYQYQKIVKEYEARLYEQQNVNQVLENDLIQYKKEQQIILLRHQEQIQEMTEKHTKEAFINKSEYKQKKNDKLRKIEKQFEQTLTQKIREIESNSSYKVQQTAMQKDDIKDVYSNLLKKFQDSHIDINQHEMIVNSQVKRAQEAHEIEIGAIKQAFEKELRRAEKMVRKEEQILKDSLQDLEKNFEKLKFEKDEVIAKKEFAIQQMSLQGMSMEEHYKTEINKLKDVCKQEIFKLTLELQCNSKEIELLKEGRTQSSTTASYQIYDYESQVKLLLQELEGKDLQIQKLQKDIQIKISQVEEERQSYEDIQKQVADQRSVIYQQEQLIRSEQQKVVQLDNVITLATRAKIEAKKYNIKILERERENVKRLRQEITLVIKMVKNNMECTVKDCNSLINQTMQQVIKQVSNISNNTQKVSLIQYKEIQLNYENLQNQNQGQIAELQKLEQQNKQLLKEIQDLKQNYEQKLSKNERKFKEEFNEVEKQLRIQRQEAEKGYENLSVYNGQIDQLRSENISLQQKLNEMDAYITEQEYVKKEIELERNQVGQQLEYEIKSRQNELEQLKQLQQQKQEQLITEFKEQCLKVREEIEQSYKQKLSAKTQKFKEKEDAYLNTENQKFQKMEFELTKKIQDMEAVHSQQREQLQNEVFKAKQDQKRIREKQKLSQLREKQTEQRLEQEVVKSLAKALNTSSHTNSKVRQGQNSQDRSYQSLPYQRIQNQRSFQSLSQNEIFGGQHQQTLANQSSSNSIINYPRSTRNNLLTMNETNQSQISNSLINQNKGYFSSINTHKDTLMRKTSNDMSNNSSFIMVSQSQQWPPKHYNNGNQIFMVNESKIDQQKTPNRLQESSIKRVLNQSEDMLIGGKSNNNDSFLIARSLSPKERTGMFGKQQNSESARK